MGLSRERKIYVGLFLVAATGLSFDRVFLGPASASAMGIDEVYADEHVELIQTSADGQVANNLSSISVIRDRLEQKSSSDTTVASASMFSFHDLFPSPETEQQSSATKQQTALLISDEGGAPQMVPHVPQSPLPTLSAVMPARNGGGAVLDGKLVRVGDVHETGYRLIRVNKRSAVVSFGRKLFEITLPVTNSP